MKKTLLLSLGFLLGLWTFCRAQNPIVPPYDNLLTGYFPSYYDQDLGITSPQAWSFMKYRGDTPDLYTGTMSVSIPIYTYQDQDFTLPISLNYASNGYIPNVQAGRRFGMGPRCGRIYYPDDSGCPGRGVWDPLRN